MKKLFLVCFMGISVFSSSATEQSECDGKANWQKSTTRSGDVLLRKCDVFGRTFIEIKDALHEDRCISIQNAKNGKHWKDFYLHEDEVKSMSFTGKKVPAQIKVVSTQTSNNSCAR
jgi:hypothetical protein